MGNSDLDVYVVRTFIYMSAWMGFHPLVLCDHTIKYSNFSFLSEKIFQIEEKNSGLEIFIFLTIGDIKLSIVLHFSYFAGYP